MVRHQNQKGSNSIMAEKNKEIKRTYEITLEGGGILFKYMTPTEMRNIKSDKANPRFRKWKKISLVGNPDKNIKRDPKPVIKKNLTFGSFKDYDDKYYGNNNRRRPWHR